MKKFIQRGILVSLPALLVSALVAWIDPFAYFSPQRQTPEKQDIAWTLNPCLGKLIEFKRSPTENILLGDSRMQSLSEAEISTLTGERYTDLAYGGASLKEVIDTFWHASKITKLKNVVIGINFPLYSDYNITYRTDTASSINENPLLYLTNRTVLHAAWLEIKRQFGSTANLGTPTVDREAFWQENLDTISKYYSHYTRPVQYKKQLAEISGYARKNSINLRFVIFPTHMEGQALVERAGLSNSYAEFKKEIQGFGEMLDFDRPSLITANKSNYKDPVHFNEKIALQIIETVWTPVTTLSRR